MRLHGGRIAFAAWSVFVSIVLVLDGVQAAPGHMVQQNQRDLQQPVSQAPLDQVIGAVQTSVKHRAEDSSQASAQSTGSPAVLQVQQRLLQQQQQVAGNNTAITISSSNGSQVAMAALTNSAAVPTPMNLSNSTVMNQQIGQPNGNAGAANPAAAVQSSSQQQQTFISPDRLRVGQIGTGNDQPTAPEGGVPAIPTAADATTGVPLYISPNPTFESTTEINIDQELLQIPQSFLGISHEWTHVEEMNNIPGYKDILNMLTGYGSGPMVIRVGGGSTDKQAYVFPQYVYEALRDLHEETGVHYILGINFEKGDIELARQQMELAKSILPLESILSFEIGNEPNYYDGTKKDAQGNSLTALQYVRTLFVPDWYSFAKQLSCPCGTLDCCEPKQFAGPVWGHVNVFPSTIKWFLDQTANFVEMTTLHWYKATKETYNTPLTLLEEAPIRKEMDNLRALVQTSQSYGIPLRVAEMNTISNSGRVGVSNVFAAALWTLDGCFEVAATGAVGVNFHQGSGQNLYTAILRWYSQNVLNPPVLRPPFYGMMMFQQAVLAGSKLLGKTQISEDSGSLKVWPLVDAATRDLRVVLINKHPSEGRTQVIRLNRNEGEGYDAPASVSRLVARGEDPLSATSSITLGGYYYAVGGVQKGADATESVVMAPTDDGMVSWTIYMPPGSAALVTIPWVPQ